MRNRNKEKIISIDFDWVLAKYEWYKWEEITWEPIEGAIEFVEKLQRNWYTPVIHTTRRIDVIEKRLKENKKPLDAKYIKTNDWKWVVVKRSQ